MRKQVTRPWSGSRGTAPTSRVSWAVSRSFLRTGKRTTSSVRSLAHFAVMDYASTAKRISKYLGKMARAIFAPPSPFTCSSLTASQALRLSAQRVTVTKRVSSLKSHQPCAPMIRSYPVTAKSSGTPSTTKTVSTRPYLPRLTPSTDSTPMLSFSTSCTSFLIVTCMMF